MAYQLTQAYAYQMDEQDELAYLKEEFFFPQHNGAPVIYFCGNSLGLQPKAAASAIEVELETWRNLAVGGYFGGTNPWLSYHEQCIPGLLPWLGALPHEVTVMNALTVNLHLAMVSFYRPSGKRTKILMEAGAFPSDQYAVETQVLHYGLNPEEHIIEVKPRDGEKLLRHEDIVAAIEKAGPTLALCLMSGMNYYTGQLYHIAEITSAAHRVGAFAGFDLAHVVGNVPVELHQSGVDFAVWCSYKYLNGGPGAVGGFFVHEKHGKNTSIHRFGGWWGNNEKTRFKMEKGFLPREGASGWCLSTSQVFNTVCLKASLDLLQAAGAERLRKKSIALTGYLEYLLQDCRHLEFEIITPANPAERGAQLSLYFKNKGRQIHDAMHANGIVVDYREPAVIRVAPAPAYCSFQDVFRFYTILKEKFSHE
jgi:kynureninase